MLDRFRFAPFVFIVAIIGYLDSVVDAQTDLTARVSVPRSLAAALAEIPFATADPVIGAEINEVCAGCHVGWLYRG